MNQCAVCTRVHLDLLTDFEEQETDVNIYPLIVIKHTGQDFKINGDRSILILKGTIVEHSSSRE
jgi:hypothetical protein